MSAETTVGPAPAQTPDPAVGVLLAEREIERVLLRYCRGIDRLDDAGERWLDLFACRYLDRFERRAGTWAIVRRVVVHDWDAVLPLAGDFGDMVKTFTAGRRDRDDESYRGKR